MTAPFENEHNTGDSKEKTPHAGQSHQPADIFDRPPRDFKSDLEDAKNEGLVGSDPTVFEELGVPPFTEEAVIPENELDTSPEIQERINRVTAKAAETEEKPKWHQRTAIRVGGALLALGAGFGTFKAVSGGGESSQTTNSNDTPTEPTIDTTPTTNIADPVDADYRDDAEKNNEYSPEIATGLNASKVVQTIYGNLEKALEERETSYITYYAFDTSSNYAQSLKDEIVNLKNNYDVTINTRIVEDLGIQDGVWSLRVEKQMEVYRTFSDGTKDIFYTEEPEIRNLELREQTFNPHSDPQLGWTIDKDTLASE